MDLFIYLRIVGFLTTMGGLLFGFCMLFSTFLWSDLTNKYVWLTVMVFVGFGRE